MATDLENLLTIRSNLLASLAAASANPKRTYTVGNQSTDYDGWRASLMEQVKEVNAQIANADAFEVEVQGIPG